MKPKVKGVVDLKELIASLQQDPNYKISPELQAVMAQDAALRPSKAPQAPPGTAARAMETGKSAAASIPPPPPTPPGSTVVSQRTVQTPTRRQQYDKLPADARTATGQGMAKTAPKTAAVKPPSKTQPTTGAGRVGRGFLKGLLGKKGYSVFDDIRDEIHSLSTQVARVDKKSDVTEKRSENRASRLLTAVRGLMRGVLGARGFSAVAQTFGGAKKATATAERVSVESNKTPEQLQRVPMAAVPRAVDQAKTEFAEGQQKNADQAMAAQEKTEEKHDKETKTVHQKLDKIIDDLDHIKRKAVGGTSGLLMGLLAMVGKVWKWLKNTLWKRLVLLGEWLGKKLWGALGSLMRAIKNIKMPSLGGAARAAVGAFGAAAVNVAAVVGWDAGEKEMNRAKHTRKMTPLFEKYGLKELGNGKFEIDGKKYKRVGEQGEEPELPTALENLVTIATEDPRGGRAQNAQKYLSQHKDELDTLEASHQQYLSDHPEAAKGQAKVLAAKKAEDAKTFTSDVKSDINAVGGVVGIKPFDEEQMESDNPFAADADTDDFDVDKVSAASLAGLTRPDAAVAQKLQDASSANQQMKEDADIQTIIVSAPAPKTPAQATPMQVPQKPSNPVIITTRNPESTIQRMNSLLFDDPSGFTSLYRN